jgi:hypothetical protein
MHGEPHHGQRHRAQRQIDIEGQSPADEEAPPIPANSNTMFTQAWIAPFVLLQAYS